MADTIDSARLGEIFIDDSYLMACSSSNFKQKAIDENYLLDAYFSDKYQIVKHQSPDSILHKSVRSTLDKTLDFDRDFCLGKIKLTFQVLNLHLEIEKKLDARFLIRKNKLLLVTSHSSPKCIMSASIIGPGGYKRRKTNSEENLVLINAFLDILRNCEDRSAVLVDSIVSNESGTITLLCRLFLFNPDMNLQFSLPSFALKVIFDRNLVLYPKKVHLDSEKILRDVIQPDNKTMSTSGNRTIFIQPDQLIPQLLNFQRKSVQWMLLREGKVFSENGELSDSSHVVDDLGFHSVSGQFDKTNGSDVYVDFYSGKISLSKKPEIDLTKVCTGGILAEEMGLGKSLELIALILLNPFPYKQPARRSDETGLIHAKTTLIFAPSSILDQWATEISTHAPSLSVHVYDGCSSISAEQMAEYDIVLTTYDIRTRDLHLARPDNQRSRRKPRVYERPKTPLTMIKFWRLVADEAQMVENSYNAAAELTALIPRENTWAVTGTPLGNTTSTVRDLHGLFTFLGLNTVFNSCVQFEDRLYALLRLTMRRNSKLAVENELHIPKQYEETIGVEFNSVERHFYNDLVRKMAHELRTEQSFSDLSVLRQWVLRLRQTCCHPQIGQQNRQIFGSTFRSIPEVLNIMFQKAISSQYSYHRQKLTSLVKKGMLLELEKRYIDAEQIYKNLLVEIDEALSKLRLEMKKNHSIAREHSSFLGEATDKNMKTQIAGEKSQDDQDITDQDDDDDNKQQNQEIDERELDLEEIDRQQERHSRLGASDLDFSQTAISRLLSWLQLKHQVVFCLASVYLQLSENVSDETNDSKKDNTPKNQYKIRSDELFEQAESIRSEIMAPSERAVDRSRQALLKFHRLNNCQLEQSMPDRAVEFFLDGLPDFDVKSYQTGLESFFAMEHIVEIKNWLDKQAIQLLEYRRRVLEISVGSERQLHQDYGTDAKLQELGHLYQDCLRDAIARRKHVLSSTMAVSATMLMNGSLNPNSRKRALRTHKSSVAVEQAVNNTELNPDQTLIEDEDDSLEIPEPEDQLPLPGCMQTQNLCLKSIITQLENILTRQQSQNSVRSQERDICRKLLFGEEGNGLDSEMVMRRKKPSLLESTPLKPYHKQQIKQCELLESELVFLTRLWNTRVIFYKSLQKLSDQVALPPSESGLQQMMLVELEASFKLFDRQYQQEASRVRYLENLMMTIDNSGESDNNSHKLPHQSSSSSLMGKLCEICHEALIPKPSSSNDANGGEYISDNGKRHINQPVTPKPLLITRCGHLFCEECLMTWFRRLKNVRRCPVCRCGLGSRNTQQHLALNPSLSKSMASFGDDGFMQRIVPDLTRNNDYSPDGLSKPFVDKPASANNEQHQLNSNNTFKYNTNNNSIKGNFSAKITKVISVCIDILKADDQVKILIFSSWQEVLDITANALELNQIPTLRLDRRARKQNRKFESQASSSSTNPRQKNLWQSQAAHLFQHSGEYRVALLSLRQQASGLNLHRASHCIIIEPEHRWFSGVNDKSSFKSNQQQSSHILQARARIHRLGQTRESIVHTMFINQSIEHQLVSASLNTSHQNTSNSIPPDELIKHEISRISSEDDTGMIIHQPNPSRINQFEMDLAQRAAGKSVR